MKNILLTPRIEYLDHAWKYFVNESYVLALQPYNVQCLTPLNFTRCDLLAQNSDALIICGGYDIASHYFHAPLHEQAKLYDRPQDDYDFRLLDAFVKAKKPILGICRGLQIINVYFGGTLCQHFAVSKHEESEHRHHVVVSQDSFLQQLLPHQATVNSYHHQCAQTCGNHLKIAAVAQDGRIEALQHDTLPIIAVQWHPEKLHNDRIIPYFIHLCAHAEQSLL